MTTLDWFKICSDNYISGFYNNDSLKVFVVKGKITADQYYQITGVQYVA